MHLVGFIIRICHDAWSPERQICLCKYKKKIPIFCSLPQTSQKTPKDIIKFTPYSFRYTQYPKLLNRCVSIVCDNACDSFPPVYLFNSINLYITS